MGLFGRPVNTMGKCNAVAPSLNFDSYYLDYLDDLCQANWINVHGTGCHLVVNWLETPRRSAKTTSGTAQSEAERERGYMRDRYEKQEQKQGQLAAAKAIVAQADAVSSELFETATALKEECHELIRIGDTKRYRKPPCTLAVKSETRKIGPKIVWVTFSSNKVMLKNAKPVRFTDEVRGRKK